MQNAQNHVQDSRLAGVSLIAAAFLIGAVLGGLLVVLFCAVLPEGGVMPSRFRSVAAAEMPDARASRTTEPVSASWRTAAQARSEPVPDGWRGMGEAESAFGSEGDPQSRFWSIWSARNRQGLFVLTGIVLGACLVGATVLIWSSRRANVRLEARIRRFEQLLSQHKAGWLDDLDSALEGEWKDRR